MIDAITAVERRWHDKPYVIVLLAFLINGVALALSHNYLDGDTHSRAFHALLWLKHPFFIYLPNDVTWVFGPMHCYLNAIALTIWNDPTLTTRVLSLILTSLTILPFYWSVRLLFEKRAAFYSSFLVCFCTLFVHPSAIGASEGINLFFLFTSLYFFLRYRASSRWRDMLLSAFAALGADMMRFDSWPFVSMLALLALIFAVSDTGGAVPRVRLSASLKAVLFGFVSHQFVFIWLGAQWIKFGNPMYMMANDLDAPQIAKNVEQYGGLMVYVYHFAFLPGIMFLSAPIAFVFALLGFYLVVRSRRFNVLFWLFAVMIFYYLLTFVITLSRYPLARFTTIPTILFVCFSGVGVAFVLDHIPNSWRRRVIPALTLMMILVPVGLGFFSRPSENAIAEKLRAISPVTNPPTYYFDFVNDCRRTLAGGDRLLLDTRNYNHRLLYLDLYDYRDQIDYFWTSTDSLLSFVSLTHPPFMVRTDFPRPDKQIFDAPNGSATVVAAGVGYHLVSRRGIYCLYAVGSS